MNGIPADMLALRFTVILALAFFCSGCAYGILYTDTTEPLVVNMKSTEHSTSATKGNSIQLKEPLTVGLTVEWASRAIGDIAKTNDLETVHYADLNTFSILLGLYQKRTLTVYGEPAIVTK